ncbi:MAG TPA: hypothetical protein VGX23_13735 [Actinocrinis sp.]|nr:hypothetical protein [Actinocrinis sp.]
MSVIDLGGRAGMWMRAPFRPKHVHLVNLEAQVDTFPEWITAETGDATAIAAQSDAPQYDLVFSNSVIEHVGGFANRTSFARAVGDLAPKHWVQTPYRYFPVEPHFIFPGFQFLPLSARAEVLRRWPLVHSRPTERARALEIALSVELLSQSELRFLFPDSKILVERVGGLPKSLIAVRR